MNKIYIRGNEIATKEYVDSLSFGGGENIDLSNYYTKEEIDDYGLYVLKDLKICSSSFSGGSSYLNWVDTDENKCAQISAIFNQAVFNHDFRPVLVISDRNDPNESATSFSGIVHPAFSRSDLQRKSQTSYWYKGIKHNRWGNSYTSFNETIRLESVGLEVIGEWQEDGSFKCTSYAFLLSDQTLAQSEWVNSKFLRKDNTAAYTPSKDYNPATKLYVDTTVQNAIKEQPTYYTKEEINNIIAEANNSTQVEEMPEASVDNKGTIVQYIGDTNNTYTTGYFYQVVEETIINEDGTETIIYKWEEIIAPTSNFNEIIGNLENLNTEDKSNLVNAINEVMNNSGGGITELTEDTVDIRELPVGIYLLNGTTRIRYGNNDTQAVNSDLFKQIMVISQTLDNGYGYNNAFIFRGTSSGGSIWYIDSKNRISKSFLNNYLSKTNTTAFTPTEDYNPATKKYVDDTISNINLTETDPTVPAHVKAITEEQITKWNSNSVEDTMTFEFDLPYSSLYTIANTSLNNNTGLSGVFVYDTTIIQNLKEAILNAINNNAKLIIRVYIDGQYSKQGQYVFYQDRPLTIDSENYTTINFGTHFVANAGDFINRFGWAEVSPMYIKIDMKLNDDGTVNFLDDQFWILYKQNAFLSLDNTYQYEPTHNYHPATKKYVDDLVTTSIAGISTTSMEIATSLPTENISTSTIYLVKDETASTDTENIYNEYIYINGAWENIGSTKTTVDLSKYSTTEELSQMLSTALSNYLTTADMNAALSSYYTKTATDEAIENAINNIEHPTTDLSNYYNKQEIDTMIGDINSILDAINGEEV